MSCIFYARMVSGTVQPQYISKKRSEGSESYAWSSAKNILSIFLLKHDFSVILTIPPPWLRGNARDVWKFSTFLYRKLRDILQF